MNFCGTCRDLSCICRTCINDCRCVSEPLIRRKNCKDYLDRVKDREEKVENAGD